MSILFLMDPIESMNPKKDTSLMFVLEALKRDQDAYYLPQGGLSILNGEFTFSVQQLILNSELDASLPIQLGEGRTLNERDVAFIFIRTEPPFDSQYLMDTLLLDLVKQKIRIVNDPTGIRQVNEKIWCSQFVDLVPPTLITRDQSLFKDFVKAQSEVILKPLDGFGGRGIMKLNLDDPNLNSIFEVMSDQLSKDVMVQAFIPESTHGDKRILLLNGEPIGAVLRVHGDNDHRNNFFTGGSAKKTTLTERDKEICTQLGPHLRQMGLDFVGIDVIGDYLIEVNVTSPTCLQEINRLDGINLESDVFDFLGVG